MASFETIYDCQCFFVELTVVSFGRHSVLEKQVIGWSLPSSMMCDSTALTPYSDASEQLVLLDRNEQ